MNVRYLMDTHEVTSGEAAYNRIIKLWLPGRATPSVHNNSLPNGDCQPELWLLYHAECAVVHSDGKALNGVNVALYDAGPPGVGSLNLAWEIQGPSGLAVLRHPQPCLYGIGWAIYPAATLVSGDVVIFRAKYIVGVPRCWM